MNQCYEGTQHMYMLLHVVLSNIPFYKFNIYISISYFSYIDVIAV